MKIFIVGVAGGLGNQMFQYAFYFNLKKQLFPKSINRIFISDYKKHNGYELDIVFGIRYNLLSNLLLGFTKRYLKFLLFRYYEKNPATFENISKLNFPKLIVYFSGYWQTQKYFIDLESEIKKAFIFNSLLASDKTNKTIAEIGKKQAVCIHIRRGDYESDDGIQQVHGRICDLAYYQKAIQLMKTKLIDPFYYLFTDDIEWTINNFQLTDMIIVDWNRGKDSWQDMMMMSFCKHNIIANSSFSWWGAWLNPNPEKIIIAPKKWFNTYEAPDITPEKWIRL